MATVVLTTIGGVFGGPIGAMLGGMIGQSVDRELLFKPKGREGPRLNELAVQTSSYGTPIPKLFGTMRVAGSVIWATDLIEHRHREGGKGRPTVTSYSYTASFAVALSARPILSVGRIWADGKLLRGAAGDWKTATGFRLHRGQEDQAVDPLIASAEGMVLTPAHRGVAYAVFENLELADFGNRIPSLTFEVTADAGPVAAGAIVETLTEGAVAAGDAGQAIGGYSAWGGSVRGSIEPLVEACGAWPQLTNGRMVLTAGAGEAIVLPDPGGAGTSRAVSAIETVPRHIALCHYDPARDYQTGMQQAVRPGAGHRETVIELPAAIDAATAKRLAQAALARGEAAREGRTIRPGWRGMAVPPGARVRIADEPGDWRVVRANVEWSDVTLELERIAPAALPVSASGGRVLGAPDAVAGATILHVFEIPHVGDGVLTTPRLLIAANGAAPGWRKAALALSVDGGGNWEAAGLTALPAVIGEVVAPALAASAMIEDRRSALIVDLARADLALHDASDLARDAGANLALVGNELIQFARAEPLGGRRWRLTGLWRGRRGTEEAIGAGHAGDRFVLIEAAAMRVCDGAANVSATLDVLAVGSGEPGEARADTLVTGVSITPPSPVDLRAEPMADGAMRLRWTRRSRAGWLWRDGSDAPLGEEAERYALRMELATGEVRLESAATPEWLFPAADLSMGPITVEVRQAGDHGLSPPARITFPVE